jgi:Domain of unknown function (DUF3806)
MDDQKIEAPTDEDVTAIARAWIHANGISRDLLGEELDGTNADLARLQRILDSGVIDRTATYSLQSLGIAFGKLFVNDNPGYDWWMVEDSYGRDPAIRYQRTALLAYPRTMISKRVEDGEPVDVQELYDGLRTRLSQLIDDGYAAT